MLVKYEESQRACAMYTRQRKTLADSLTIGDVFRRKQQRAPSPLKTEQQWKKKQNKQIFCIRSINHVKKKDRLPFIFDSCLSGALKTVSFDEIWLIKAFIFVHLPELFVPANIGGFAFAFVCLDFIYLDDSLVAHLRCNRVENRFQIKFT